MLLVFLYLLGSGIGGLLAIGTCWTGVQRMMQRSMALALAQPMAQDDASIRILSMHHEGWNRAAWLFEILVRSQATTLAREGPIHLLDICGATHRDLIQTILNNAPKTWVLEVFDSQPAILHLLKQENVLQSVAEQRLVPNPGTSLEQITTHRPSYDLVLVLDTVVHSLPPHKRMHYFSKWAKLIHANTGRLVVTMEADPLSATAEAGILQNVFFRLSVAQMRLVLESCGLGQCETFYHENKVCIVARRHVETIGAE